MAVELKKVQSHQWCASCSKQGQYYRTIQVGPYAVPLCDECYDDLVRRIVNKEYREVIGV